jgi:DNA-binding PadR family transcriptional regulator
MRYPFLALLATGPAHGYELKAALEDRFGAVLPPLNAGQVYTTLARLERDGLVTGEDVPGDARHKRTYALSEAGREALRAWVREPAAATRLRDEFFLKLVLASDAGVADPQGLVDAQRRACLQALRDLSRADAAGNGTGELLLEGAALHVEADLKWLDLIERRLVRKEA